MELFNVPMKGDKISLPDPKYPDDVDGMDDPKYCHYIRCIHHVIRNSYLLKNFIIQRMINTRCLKKKKKSLLHPPDQLRRSRLTTGSTDPPTRRIIGAAKKRGAGEG